MMVHDIATDHKLEDVVEDDVVDHGRGDPGVDVFNVDSAEEMLW